MLALCEDGYFESRQWPVIDPSHVLLGSATNRLWCLLERLEASDQDVGEDDQAILPGVVFAEAAQDPSCDELAEGRSTEVDILSVTQMRLLVEELCPVDKQTVHCRGDGSLPLEPSHRYHRFALVISDRGGGGSIHEHHSPIEMSSNS